MLRRVTKAHAVSARVCFLALASAADSSVFAWFAYANAHAKLVGICSLRSFPCHAANKQRVRLARLASAQASKSQSAPCHCGTADLWLALMKSAAIEEHFHSVSLQKGRPLCLHSWTPLQTRSHSAPCNCSKADLCVCVQEFCCNRRAITLYATAARQISLSAFMKSAAIEEPFPSVSLQKGRPLCLRSWTPLQTRSHSAPCHCSKTDRFVCAQEFRCNQEVFDSVSLQQGRHLCLHSMDSAAY